VTTDAEVFGTADARGGTDLLDRAILAAKAGDRERARRVLLELTDHEPDNELAHVWLASVARGQEEALGHLRRAWQLNPSRAEVVESLKTTLLRIGVAAAEAGDDVRARAALEECCAVDPGYDRAWLWLASVAESPHSAMGHLRKVLELEPRHPLATSTLERLLLHEGMEAAMGGDRGLATEYLTEASELNPGNEQVWALLAQLAPDDGARMEALERALAVSPDNERLRATLATVRSRHEAQLEAEALLAAEPDDLATLPEPDAGLVEPAETPAVAPSAAFEPAAEAAWGAADLLTVEPVQPEAAHEPVEAPAPAAERTAASGRSTAWGAVDRSSIEWPEADLALPRQPTTIVVTQQHARPPVEATAAPTQDLPPALTVPPALPLPPPLPLPLADPAPTDPAPPWATLGSPNPVVDKPRPMVTAHASFERPTEAPTGPSPLTLNAAPAAWTLRPPADGATRVGGQPLVMVIDDSPTIRKAVSIGLEAEGYHVVTAVDGLDALRRLEEIQPDLILLDITMPGMDGYKLCRKVRAMERTKAIPVVMLSGKDGFFDKVRGRMAGCTDYITKPFASRVLLDTVAQHCGAAR
jgi:CheY-like chemotaxis protein